MKIKNSQIVNIFNHIGEVKEKNIPVKIGFAINKNIALLNSSARAYEEERKKILDKYGEKDENGNPKVIDGEFAIKDHEQYSKELGDLLGIENDIPVHTLPIEEFEKCDNEKFDSLTPNDLSVLEFMIEE